MANNGGPRGPEAVPSIPGLPLVSNEFKERLTWILSLRGQTIGSFEEELSARSRALQEAGVDPESIITRQSPDFSSTASPNSTTQTSPDRIITTTDTDRSDCEPVADKITEPDMPRRKLELIVNADASLVASMENLVVGEEAPKDMDFCPWRMVQHYPDWFIGKVNTPRVRPLFDRFHECQKWDFYYLYSPDARYTSPFLFVPTEQFTEFLKIINSQLGINLAVPTAHSRRFSYRFGMNDTPRPKYLGKVHDGDSKDRVLSKTGTLSCKDADLRFSDAKPSTSHWLRQVLDEIAKYSPGTKKKNSAVKAARNRETRRRMMEKLQDALGFKTLETVPGALGTLGFSVDKAPPFPPERAPVLVTIDVEVNEFCHQNVTEVGFAILDTEKTKNMPPGELGAAWWSQMINIHIRIEEYASHRNRKFVAGCPEKFNFGESEFVPKRQLREKIDNIFTQYTTATSSTGGRTQRDIVLVGHDLASDEKFLSSIGFDLATKNIIFRADSKGLHQHLRGADQGRGLVSVLFDFRIHASNLHNAGNDAVYTLQAAIACIIEGMKEQVKLKKTEVKPRAEELGNALDGAVYEERQDTTWVPGKTYYYADDTDDDDLPMIL